VNTQSAPSDANTHDHIGQIIVDSASALFTRFGEIAQSGARPATERRSWNAEAWAEFERAGFGLAMLPEELGGVEPRHALTIVRLAGAHAVALPVSETMAANWLLVKAGLGPASGPLTFAEGDLDLKPDVLGWRIRGSLLRVPWAQHCDVISIGHHAGAAYLARIDHPNAASIVEGSNIAGEPRDDVHFDVKIGNDRVARLPQGFGSATLRRLGAALRTAQMAGAMAGALNMSVSYARDRRQFGRPIADFQAVQQLLAVMACQAAAAGAASDLAADAILNDLEAKAIAAAKVRAGEAAGAVAAIAHQVHGAMGFTREHSLHHLTRRLWAWRDEFGGESEWSIELGRKLVSGGSTRLWSTLTEI
jgi:acyl-CoA dehydrogenase